MIPAHQGLGARQSRRFLLDGELGLIVHIQLVLVQGAVQVVAQVQAELVMQTHFLVVDHQVVLEVPARHAAGRPRPVKHLFGPKALLPGHDAHAHADIRAREALIQARLETVQHGPVIRL